MYNLSSTQCPSDMACSCISPCGYNDSGVPLCELPFSNMPNPLSTPVYSNPFVADAYQGMESPCLRRYLTTCDSPSSVCIHDTMGNRVTELPVPQLADPPIKPLYPSPILGDLYHSMQVFILQQYLSAKATHEESLTKRDAWKYQVGPIILGNRHSMEYTARSSTVEIQWLQNWKSILLEWDRDVLLTRFAMENWALRFDCVRKAREFRDGKVMEAIYAEEDERQERELEKLVREDDGKGSKSKGKQKQEEDRPMGFMGLSELEEELAAIAEQEFAAIADKRRNKLAWKKNCVPTIACEFEGRCEFMANSGRN